jgi:hypothetical protein
MNIDLLGVGLAVASMAGYFFRPVFEAFGRKVGRKITGVTLSSLASDSTMVHIVASLFLKAEKVLPGETGDTKFIWVKDKFLKLCPDAMDEVADAFLRGVYDGMKKRGSSL